MRHLDSAARGCGLSCKEQSRKLCETNPVSSIGDRNLGVFVIAKVTAEYAGAVPPTHLAPDAKHRLGELAKARHADCVVDWPYAARPLAVAANRTSLSRSRLGFHRAEQ